MEADAFNWFSVFFAGCANRWSIQLELIGKLHASQMFLVCVCMCVTVLLVDKFCCCGEPFYVVLKLDVFSSVLSACAGVSAELYKHMVNLFSGPVTQVNDYVIMRHTTSEWLIVTLSIQFNSVG